METPTQERRRTRRFHIRMSLHYRVSQKGAVTRSGSGLTVDMSTDGVSFRCRKPLPEGAHIEIAIDWPARYGDVYPIDLLVTGFVVRSDHGRTAVRMTSRRFRISSQPAEPIRATA